MKQQGTFEEHLRKSNLSVNITVQMYPCSGGTDTASPAAMIP